MTLSKQTGLSIQVYPKVRKNMVGATVCLFSEQDTNGHLNYLFMIQCTFLLSIRLAKII